MMQSSALPRFTMAGLRAGAASGLVLVPGGVVYGMAFGVMAAAAGLGAAEVLLFSAWVYAGGAQMAALQAWGDPVPIAAVFLTSLAMNTRYLLLGAALRPWFRGLPAWQSYPALFVLGDANWVMAIKEYEKGARDAAFLAGSGAVMWITWVAASAAGHLGGQMLARPERLGVDFMIAAFFATMAVPFFRKASALWPLLTGITVAVLVERLVPGPWYILAGALAGSLVGAALPISPDTGRRRERGDEHRA
jgi:4-azaleucine resistance transporter AzlC